MNSFPHSIDITPGVLLFVVSKEMNVRTTRSIAQFVLKMDELPQTGIVELVPSYASILVIYDDIVNSPSGMQCLVQRTWNQVLKSGDEEEASIVTVDVIYGDIFGEDLANVSENSGKSVDEVITLHVEGMYTVGAVGFAPGFTYLIGLPPEIAVPRRLTPRLRVPAGSVGIGGNQTGVYALPSAGGWNLIGRSPTRLFDPANDAPVKLKLGDTVRFNRVNNADFSALEPVRAQPRGDGPIEVVAPGLQTTVQDLGRYGMARYGFATDGAADRASLVAANKLVGNKPATSALEMTHQGPTFRFHRRMVFGIAGADLGARLNGRAIPANRRFETMPGDELSFQFSGSAGARAYLAVTGGFDVPLVMGSASTNLIAGVGGWHGRELLRGDRLSVGQSDLPNKVFTPGMQSVTDPGDTSPFRIVAGPQRARFDDATWRRLLESDFTVGNDANRVGLRLEGPSLAPVDGADMLSEGIVTGSIQVTGDGQAIVMLPSHATIGGYTKIATIIPRDWDRLGQISPGDTMRFREWG